MVVVTVGGAAYKELQLSGRKGFDCESDVVIEGNECRAVGIKEWRVVI